MTKKTNPVAKTAKKVANEGNLAEGVLGAAIVAKIIERQPNGAIGKINHTHVNNIIKIMQKAPSKMGATKKQTIKVDAGGSAKDRITFFLNLGVKMMSEFRSAEPAMLQRLAQGAASYANSSRMEALAQALYNNNINNQIAIDVDGISANTATKSDVMVKVDKFVFDKISLKAGSMKTGHTLGQVGGNSWASLLRVFNEGFNERSKVKETGLRLTEFSSKTNEQQYLKLIGEKPTFDTVARGVQFAYKKASEVFNRQAQPVMASNIYEFLRFHASRGDSDVKIVKLHNGRHKTLDPLKLEDALSKVKKLEAVTRVDTQWPMVLIYDADAGGKPSTIYSPNVIFSITVKIDTRQMGYIYHLVKEGARFESLIEEKDMNSIRWKLPSVQDEMKRIQKAAAVFGLPADVVIQEFKKATLTTLTHEMWNKTENIDPGGVPSNRELDRLDSIYKQYETGGMLPAPIILEVDKERPYLVTDGLWLIVAKELGVTPKVVVVKMLRRKI